MLDNETVFLEELKESWCFTMLYYSLSQLLDGRFYILLTLKFPSEF